MSGAVSGIAYLLVFAMFVWGASTFWPITMNSDLTRFGGKYFRWRIEHITGTVLASDTLAHTTVTTTYYQDSGPRRSSYTALHSDVRLQPRSGKPVDVHLVNFGNTCRPGDIATVWYARKGRKKVAFAALNLTTDQGYKPPRGSGIGEIIITHNLLFPLLLVPTLFAAFLAGGGAFFLAILMIAATGAGWNLTRRRFLKRGTKVLWQRSMEEAQALQEVTD